MAEFLLGKGYEIYGLLRRSSTDPMMRIEDLYLLGKIKIVNGNLRDAASLERSLEEAKPDEIYNLAAQSDVGISFKCPEETFEVNYHGLGRLMQAAMKICPKAKIYQASTSEMFGKTRAPQNEDSPFQPVSPYGQSKLRAHEDYVVGYREKHGLFICSGILFNHESPRRGKHFVTRKITHSLAKISLGLQDCFELGSLDVERDWGYAGDYVEAMWLMLQNKRAEDFVIATGEPHTVREFFEVAARALDIKFTWRGEGLKEVAVEKGGKVILKINEKYFRPREVHHLCGDAKRARQKLNWKPKVSFGELAAMMALSDLKTLSLTFGVAKTSHRLASKSSA